RPSESPCKAGDHPLSDAIAAFVLSRQVGNCSSRTVGIYRDNLGRFQRETGAATLEDVSRLLIQRHLTRLREHLRPVSVHQHYRCLRALFAWCVGAGLIPANPMQGM